MKNKSKKWWFWVIVVVLLLIIINPNFKNGVQDGLNNTLNDNSIEESNIQKEELEESNVSTVKEERGEESKYLTSYEWKCSDDVIQEQKKESQILAIENDDYSGIKIEHGKYKITYSFKEYWDLKNSNKYNRYYNIYVSNKLETSTDEVINDYKYTFSPGSDKEYIVELQKGQYLYIEHTANQYAGNGDLKIEKIDN